jgi:hypothetical protein
VSGLVLGFGRSGLTGLPDHWLGIGNHRLGRLVIAALGEPGARMKMTRAEEGGGERGYEKALHGVVC